VAIPLFSLQELQRSRHYSHWDKIRLFAIYAFPFNVSLSVLSPRSQLSTLPYFYQDYIRLGADYTPPFYPTPVTLHGFS